VIPHLEERQIAAGTWNQKSYEKALARAHLTAVEMIPQEMHDALPSGVQPGDVFDLPGPPGAPRRRAVLIAVSSSSPVEAAFARDAGGTIHPVVAREKVVSRVTYVQCGCDPYGSGGGAPKPNWAWVSILPAGDTTLGPPVTVRYRTHRVDLRWDNGRRRCPLRP